MWNAGAPEPTRRVGVLSTSKSISASFVPSVRRVSRSPELRKVFETEEAEWIAMNFAEYRLH